MKVVGTEEAEDENEEDEADDQMLKSMNKLMSLFQNGWAICFYMKTLIYFYDPIEVEQDQVIEGCLTLTQSKENRRFMNIDLEYTSEGRFFVKESVMR